MSDDKLSSTTAKLAFDLADPDAEARLLRMLQVDDLCSLVWELKEGVVRRWLRGDISAEDALSDIADRLHAVDHIMAHYR